MKLLDMMVTVNKDDSNVSVICHDQEFYRSIGFLDSHYHNSDRFKKVVDYDCLFNKRVVCYWLMQSKWVWAGNDVIGGCRVIYFDGKPIGLYEKSLSTGIDIRYVNDGVVLEVREFIASLYRERVPYLNLVYISDGEQWDDMYQLTYGSQVVDCEAIYKKESVLITRTKIIDEEGDWMLRCVEITRSNGSSEVVHMGDLWFRYKLDKGVGL